MRGLFFTLYAIPGIAAGAYAGTQKFKMSCRDSAYCFAKKDYVVGLIELFANGVVGSSVYAVAGFLWWPIYIPDFIEDLKKEKD